MGSCYNCKNYVRREVKTRWSNAAMDYIDEVKTPRHCAIGNTTLLDKWWEENGHKREVDEYTEYECFEMTETAKMLDNMLEKTQEILELLRK